MGTATAHAKIHREVEFLRRYKQLLKWAERLTDPDRGLAQDIVHDAFVQFMLSGTDYGSIDNIDHYLHEVLRNVHRTHVRQRSPRRFEQLSELNVDSTPVALADPYGVVHAKNTLLTVCYYVCRRKDDSIASSILVLRFLHGYYPNEVAKLTRRTRSAVDVLLKSARCELKQYLSALPSCPLPDIDKTFVSSDWKTGISSDMFGVRQILFEARKGSCFGSERLRAIYSNDKSRLSRAELSHLVSCPQCLDSASAVLGLVPQRERSLFDALGKIPAVVGALVFVGKVMLHSYLLSPPSALLVSDWFGALVDLSAYLQDNVDTISDLFT